MTLFSIGIRDDGEVLTVTKAPHQADDCDGLTYRARDEEGHDVFLFFISAVSQGDAVIYARETFDGGEYVALDPIWQPGSIWPDRADDATPEQACVQIYSRQLGRGYITTVPTHGKTNPFIDCYGDEIMWAYMRDITARLVDENIYWQRWAQEHKPIAEVPQEREAVAEPTQAKQLSFDFG